MANPLASVQFDEYQKFTDDTAVYPKEAELIYVMLGGCGEAAEYAGKILPILEAVDSITIDDEHSRNTFVAMRALLNDFVAIGERLEKIKKDVRKQVVRMPSIRPLNEEERIALAKEGGDKAWYLARDARALGMTLSQLIDINIQKLSARKDKGTLIGEGDNR